MKKQEEYKEHIKEGWRFSNDIAKELVDDEQLQSTLSVHLLVLTFETKHFEDCYVFCYSTGNTGGDSEDPSTWTPILDLYEINEECYDIHAAYMKQ